MYRKVRMACDGSCSLCGRMEICDYLDDAPDEIGPEEEWKLKEERMTGTDTF